MERGGSSLSAPLDIAGRPNGTNIRKQDKETEGTRKIESSPKIPGPISGRNKKHEGKTIKLVQVNLNKSNSAMQELTISLKKEKDFICMITEPSVIRHRLSCIPKHYNTIPAIKENSPRAAIFTSQSITIQEISNLGHRDLAVGLIKCGNKQTAIISAYMDIKSSPISEQLENAIGYCKNKGYSILLTVDTNSHSKLWGNETNNRGRKWEEFIEKEQFLIHNQGKIPTFESKNGKSIIDVTLSYRLSNSLENWRVLRSYNGTDHNTIHYSLKDLAIDIPAHRLYHKANWDKFTQLLRDSHINIPSEMTECKLDKMVNKLNYILNKALDNSCPVAKARSIDPNNPWWTSQLKEMRHKVTKTYDKYKNDRKNESLEKLYKKQHREYKKVKRKAKKTYENIQNETVSDEEAMAKKIKKHNNQYSTQSHDNKTLIWESHGNWKRDM